MLKLRWKMKMSNLNRGKMRKRKMEREMENKIKNLIKINLKNR